MSGKKTHFGRAGEYFAMSELLLRGWNVAVPVVDVGDDVFVIDDNDKTTFRLQVKAGTVGTSKAKFNLSRKQLAAPQAIELFFMLLVRGAGVWHFVIARRADLHKAREEHLAASTTQPKRGRPPLADDVARTDDLLVEVGFTNTHAEVWGAKFSLDQWPADLPELLTGPGQSKPPGALATPAEAPSQSPDPES